MNLLPKQQAISMACSTDDALASAFDRFQLIQDDESLVYQCDLLDSFDQSAKKQGHTILYFDQLMGLLSKNAQLITQPVAEPIYFVSELAPGPLKQALSYISPLRSLQVVESVKLQISSLKLLNDDQQTVVKAKVLKLINPHDPGLNYCLLLPASVRGYNKAFNHFIKSIEQFAVKGSSLYRQLIPGYLDYDPKPSLALTKQHSAAQAASQIIRSYLQVVRANEPGIIHDRDTEHLHDYRVALRKIRSVLSLFKGVYVPQQTRQLKAAFSELMADTSQLRDLDVYRLERSKFERWLPDAKQPGLEQLFTLIGSQRKKQHLALSVKLQSEQYTQQLIQLEQTFTDQKPLKPGPKADQTAIDYAKSQLWRRYQSVGKTAAKIDDSTTDETIHQLRRHCKKLRYLIEFFTPLLPQAEIKQLTKAMKKLQETLGHFNDYSVQLAFLEAILKQSGDEPSAAELKKSVKSLIKIIAVQQQQEREKIQANFSTFYSKQTRHLVRQLFNN